MVEFALLLPVFMTLVLGMFSGGMAYNRKIGITNGAREGTRYGATLPVTNYSTMAEWLDDVAAAAVDGSTGDMDTSVDGRYLCVAYVYPNGETASPIGRDRTTRRQETGTAVTYETSDDVVDPTCFDDNRPNAERRVQVLLQRESDLELLFFARTLTLSSQSVAKFEPRPAGT